VPKKSVNQFERANRAWPVLVRVAREGHPITYGDLGKEIGVHHRPVRFVLAKIQEYCQQDGKLPLTIVAQNRKGEVGPGFIAWDHDDIENGRNAVYSFPWHTLSNPFEFAADGTQPEEIARGLAANAKDAKDKFARVKVRGVAQAIFRRALLDLYNRRCAISGEG
jgi:putative restriction endonuclease